MIHAKLESESVALPLVAHGAIFIRLELSQGFLSVGHIC